MDKTKRTDKTNGVFYNRPSKEWHSFVTAATRTEEKKPNLIFTEGRNFPSTGSRKKPLSQKKIQATEARVFKHGEDGGESYESQSLAGDTQTTHFLFQSFFSICDYSLPDIQNWCSNASVFQLTCFHLQFQLFCFNSETY